MKDELKELKEDAERALACLYLAASKPVADDVNEKVKAYIKKLESSIPGRRDLDEKEKEKGRSSTYWEMSPSEQWAEDKRLGILDWDGN